MGHEGQEESSATVSSARVDHSDSPSTQTIASNPALAGAIKGLVEQILEERDAKIKHLELQVANLDKRNSKEVLEAVRDKHIKNLEETFKRQKDRVDELYEEVFTVIPSRFTTYRDEDMHLSMRIKELETQVNRLESEISSLRRDEPVEKVGIIRGTQREQHKIESDSLGFTKVRSSSPPKNRKEEDKPRKTPTDVDDPMQKLVETLTAAFSSVQIKPVIDRLDTRKINFPKLASRASVNDNNSNMKDGQAYRTWKPLAVLELQRLNLLYIVEQDPPADLTSTEGERWVQGNANIFKSLSDMLHSDEVERIIHLIHFTDSSRQAWRELEKLYFRTGQFDYMHLRKELNETVPTSGEDMPGFVNRIDRLIQKAKDYNVDIPDHEICNHVFQKLTEQHNSWGEIVDSLPENTMTWTWVFMTPILLKVDRRRRAIVTDKVAPMYPPLGYKYKTKTGVIQEISWETPTLPTIKTKVPKTADVVYPKGTPRHTGSTPRSPFASRSPRSPGSARGTPRSPRTPTSARSSRLNSPNQSPRGLSQTKSGAKSARGRTRCTKCGMLGHWWRDTECPKYEAGWHPSDDTPRAGSEGGKRSSSK